MSFILMDQKVAQIKFAKEVETLMEIYPDLRKKGWIIESTQFPYVRVTFLATNITPPAALFTVEINFENYNLMAPSVKFLHPVTGEQMKPIGLQNTNGIVINVIIDSHPDSNLPFLCLVGTNEYHSHPQHSGDAWDLHRYSGRGKLYYILDKIWLYCVKIIINYHFKLEFDTPAVLIRAEAQL